MIDLRERNIGTVSAAVDTHHACSVLQSRTDAMGRAVLDRIRMESVDKDEEGRKMKIFLKDIERDFDAGSMQDYASIQHVLGLLSGLLESESTTELSKWISDMQPLIVVPTIGRHRLAISQLLGDKNKKRGILGLRLVESESIVRATMYRPVFVSQVTD